MSPICAAPVFAGPTPAILIRPHFGDDNDLLFSLSYEKEEMDSENCPPAQGLVDSSRLSPIRL